MVRVNLTEPCITRVRKTRGCLRVSECKHNIQHVRMKKKKTVHMLLSFRHHFPAERSRHRPWKQNGELPCRIHFFFRARPAAWLNSSILYDTSTGCSAELVHEVRATLLKRLQAMRKNGPILERNAQLSRTTSGSSTTYHSWAARLFFSGIQWNESDE